MLATCAWCDAPRAPGPKCPTCGAIYAKAEALQGGAVAPRSLPLDPATDAFPAPRRNQPPRVDLAFEGLVDDLRLEWILRLTAIPTALALAVLLHRSSLGHMLQRTFLSMMVHEAGHAVTAWFCGFAAFPALWVTYTADVRGAVVPLLLATASGWLVLRGLRVHRAATVAAGSTLLSLQLAGTLLAGPPTARALVTFGGDGGAMVLGTGLMAAFFCGPETQVYRRQLRWGLLVIGSSAFVDPFATWWAALGDLDAIPFGEIEGVGLSDPSKLTEIYGWAMRPMVHRYVALGIGCLLALAAAWGLGVRAARRAYLGARSPRSAAGRHDAGGNARE